MNYYQRQPNTPTFVCIIQKLTKNYYQIFNKIYKIQMEPEKHQAVTGTLIFKNESSITVIFTRIEKSIRADIITNLNGSILYYSTSNIAEASLILQIFFSTQQGKQLFHEGQIKINKDQILEIGTSVESQNGRLILIQQNQILIKDKKSRQLKITLFHQNQFRFMEQQEQKVQLYSLKEDLEDLQNVPEQELLEQFLNLFMITQAQRVAIIGQKREIPKEQWLKMQEEKQQQTIAKQGQKKVERGPGQIHTIQMVEEFIFKPGNTYLYKAFKFQINLQKFKESKDFEDHNQNEQKKSLIYNSQKMLQNNIFMQVVKQKLLVNSTESEINGYLINYLIRKADDQTPQKGDKFSQLYHKYVEKDLQLLEKKLRKQGYSQEVIKKKREQRKQKLKGQNCIEIFSDPQSYLKLFIFMYCGQELYKKINKKLVQENKQDRLTKEAFQNNFSVQITSLIMKGLKAILDSILIKQNQQQLNKHQYFFRGIKTDPKLIKSQKYCWPAFTSLAFQKKIAQGQNFGGNKYLFIVYTIRGQQKSLGLSIHEWMINTTLKYFQGLLPFQYQSEVILLPGFPFICFEILFEGNQNQFYIKQIRDGEE